MKKTAIFSSALALMIVLVGTSTAQASTHYTYYPAATNYYDTYRNCTPHNSDLGLGGGVFVSGTTICPTPVIQYSQEYSSTTNKQYDTTHKNGSHYYEDESYDDHNADEDEDSQYDEDHDSDYDDSGNNHSGGSSTIW